MVWAALSYLTSIPWILAICLWASLILSLLFIPLYLKHNPHKDPQEIVIDEAIGVFIMLMLIPHSVSCVLSGFILFRILDIWKPWPISWIDRFGGTTLKNTISLIGDDILAGLLAGGLTQAIFYLLEKSSISF